MKRVNRSPLVTNVWFFTSVPLLFQIYLRLEGRGSWTRSIDLRPPGSSNFHIPSCGLSKIPPGENRKIFFTDHEQKMGDHSILRFFYRPDDSTYKKFIYYKISRSLITTLIISTLTPPIKRTKRVKEKYTVLTHEQTSKETFSLLNKPQSLSLNSLCHSNQHKIIS